MRTRDEHWFNSSQRGWGGWVLACTALLLMGTANTFAQSGRASISGGVVDPSNAVVPGAKIVVTNIDTGQSREAVSVDNGTYVIPLLQVGNYKATCSHEGFKTATHTGIVLTADDKATVNFSLTLGDATQIVEVVSGTELMNTSTGAIGQVVDQKTIAELPLNGRNPAELVTLAPGAVDGLKSGGFARQYYTTFPTESAASVNGGMQGSVYYMLDGGSNMDSYHNNAFPFPNPDATAEFRVLTNNFDAQYGFSPGAVVSIVTKSGTNAWHGDAFEFLRNGVLNARDFFATSRDTLQRNQFGGSLGGPILKNKLFIFGNYQGTTLRRTVQGGGIAGFVPNNKMLTGDFSDVCTNNGGTMSSTGTCSAAAGQLRDPDTGQPVPFNYFDPSTFSPVAMNFINLTLPRTDSPTGATPLTGRKNIQNFNEYTIKADYFLNEKNHISGRYYNNHYENPAFNSPGNMLLADRSWLAPYSSWSVNWASTITPTLVNNFVFSYGQLNSNSNPGYQTKDGGPVCVKCMGMNVEEYPTTPASLIMWTNGYWATQNTNYINRHNINLSESMTWAKGKHNIAFGVDYYHQYWELGTDWLADELMGFDGRFTGSDFSDFLLGKMSQFTQGGGEFSLMTGSLWAPYFQDSIKLKPNFTLNLGLRWEPYQAIVPSNGRMPAFRPGQKSTRFPNAPVGLVYPGDQGVGAGGTQNTYNNWSPRVSFAWLPGALRNTSIRASFGIFMAPAAFSSNNANADTAPFSPTFAIDPSFNGGKGIPFDDPWSVYAPTGYKTPVPPFASPGYVPPSDAAFILPVDVVTNYDPQYQLGRVQTWNLAIEHQFTPNTLIRAAYVGSQSYHLFSTNQSNPGIYNANPALNGQRLLYTDFANVNTSVAWGTASYNGLQLTFEKRWSKGFQFISNYSWSKGLDNVTSVSGGFGTGFTNPWDSTFDRGLSSTHFPQIWTSSGVYELPFFTNSSNKFVKGVLGNWEVTGIYRLQSGMPFSISGGGGNPSGTNLGRERADYTGQPLNVHQGAKGQWLQTYFNRAAFVPTATGTFGNSGRNIITGPGVNSCDLGIYKNIPIKDQFRVQFRMQMYNAFNRAHFDIPNNNPASSAFGQITSTWGYNAGSGGGQEQAQFGYPNRIIEFGLKIQF